MDLVEYLKQNQQGLTGNSSHKALIKEAIAAVPKITGFSTFEAYTEVGLVGNPTIAGRVDAVIYSQGRLALLEGKMITGLSKEHRRNELNKQLRRGYQFFRERFSVAPSMFGVYRMKRGNLQSYELERPIEDMILAFK